MDVRRGPRPRLAPARRRLAAPAMCPAPAVGACRRRAATAVAFGDGTARRRFMARHLRGDRAPPGRGSAPRLTAAVNLARGGRAPGRWIAPAALVARAARRRRRECRRLAARAPPRRAAAGRAEPRSASSARADRRSARRRAPGGGRRVANVDVLRALAALAVLAGHAYCARRARDPRSRPSAPTTCPLITLATGVWLFFAISGYVIARPFVDRLRRAASRCPRCGRYAAAPGGADLSRCTGSR